MILTDLNSSFALSWCRPSVVIRYLVNLVTTHAVRGGIFCLDEQPIKQVFDCPIVLIT